MPEPLETFLHGMSSVAKMMAGSGISFWIANAVPESQEIAKAASALTGWGLAICCIYTLMKVVKTLFEKMEKQRIEFQDLLIQREKEHAAKVEEKDRVISELHETAVSKSERQREEMLNELKIMNSKKQ